MSHNFATSNTFRKHNSPSFRGEARRLTPIPVAPTSFPSAADHAAAVDRSRALHPSSMAPSAVETMAVAAVVASVPSVDLTPLDTMTRQALRTEAKRLGIVGAQRLLKDDLLASVKAATLAEVAV